MNRLEAYQELNSHLAKTVNQLKCELKKTKDSMILLHRQLETVHEINIELTAQQSNLFKRLEQYEKLLD